MRRASPSTRRESALTADESRTPTRRVCSVAYTHYRSDPRVRREAEALRDAGVEVTVLALREDDTSAVLDVDGVGVVGLGVARVRGDGLLPYLLGYGIFFVWAAGHLTRRVRHYDLVQVHTIPEFLVFAAFAARLSGRPVVLDVHDLSTEVMASRRGTAPAALRALERASLQFPDRLLTVHDHYRDLLVARGVPRDRIGVVINAPDEALFPELPPHRPSESLRVIFHGTLVERLGLGVLLPAVAAAREQVPGIHLDIVGDGDFRPRIEQLIADLELDEIVHLTPGAVPVDEVPAWIERADVGVAPFLADSFTAGILPTKVLEYARMGRAVITTPNRVLEHYFDDDALLYTAAGDVAGLADALVSTAQDPGAAVERAGRAQRFFEQEGWASAKVRFVEFMGVHTS